MLLLILAVLFSDPGERITLASCGPCHLADDGRLSGKLLTDVPKSLGKIYSSNITSDRVHGIGGWSDESLEKLIRTGVKPNGKKANILMPRYMNMADDDVRSIIRFLKSGNGASKASGEATQASKLKLPAKLAPVVKKIKTRDPMEPINKPDTLQHIAYGKYLVDDVLHCYSCHSRSATGVNFNHPDQSKGYLGGGAKFPAADGSTIRSRNLTFENETGIGKYSVKDFIAVMITGKRMNGEYLRFPMPVYPMLTNNDLKSIYSYLETVPKIRNEIRNPGNKPLDDTLSKYGCNNCHQQSVRTIGPSFEAIAKRNYSREKLIDLVFHPEPANWPGYPAMPVIDSLNREDMARVADWITTLNRSSASAK